MKRTKGLFKGYRITNKITKKQYIGITSKSVSHRWGVHKRDCKQSKYKYKNHLYNSMIKYGIENFEIKSIMKADSWEEICAWEMQAIKEYGTKSPSGYNLTDGGDGCLGREWSEATRRKLSEIKKEYYKNPKHRQEQKARINLKFEDPIYRKKHAIRCSADEFRKQRSEIVKSYWDEGHQDRRKKTAETMSKGQQARLKNPEYIKWRKENPPGGKPMLYRGKYFRTATEAMDYFKVGCNRITMDILKQVEGCRKLNVKKKSKYPYEIKY